jgi:hypothetical protein
MRRIDACAAGLAKSRRKYGVVVSGAKLCACVTNDDPDAVLA